MSETTRKKINKSTTSKYQTDYPAEYLKICSTGGGRVDFLAKIGICHNTFVTWCETYPEMEEARVKGKVLAEHWWREQARAHLVTYSSKEDGSTNFDSSLYKWTMGGRFGYSSKKKFKFPKLGDDVMKNYQAVLKEAEKGCYEASEVKTAVDIVATGVMIVQNQELVRKVEELQAQINAQQQQKVDRPNYEDDDGA